MNIGTSKQEKLTVIRYVHKRANIFGLLIDGIAAAIIIWLVIAGNFRPGVLAGIAWVFASLAMGLCAGRFIVWGFYWWKSSSVKSNVTGAVKEYEATTKIYHINNGKVTVRKANIGDIAEGVAIFALFTFFVAIFVGMYFAVKHLILQIILTKQLEAKE